MSKAMKCDRCGKFYEKNRVKWNCGGSIARGINVVNTNNIIAVECDSCIEDFRAFMNHYDDTEEDKNGEEGTE